VVILSIILTGCKSVPFNFSELRPNGKISNKIPSLEPKIYISSLENAYSRGKSHSFGGAHTTSGLGGLVTIGGVTTTSYADVRVNDALVLLERETKDNICDYLGETKGSIVFKITNSKFSFRDGVSKARSGIDLFIGCGASAIIGLPLAFLIAKDNIDLGVTIIVLSSVAGFTYLVVRIVRNIKTFTRIQEIEIEVEIKDIKNNPIARYSGYGIGEVRNDESDAINPARRPNIIAIKNAMLEIKQKINQDSEIIIKKLN